MTSPASTLIALTLALAGIQAGEASAAPEPPSRTIALSQVLGRPSERTIALNVLSAAALEACVEYGAGDQAGARQTPVTAIPAGVPTVIEIGDLAPDTAYRYRLRTRAPGTGAWTSGAECGFRTRRAAGGTFAFTVQGDSHPERDGKMFHPDLYAATLQLVAAGRPDFHIALGDDFSIERLIERKTLTQANVDQVYARQRHFLGLVGASSALFLVNGNHEQAGRHWLDGTADNPAVLAGRARNAYFALPAPDGFYSGDAEPVERIGLLRDYYAWTWGDALFVVIDPYWHSPVPVDHDRNGAKGRKGDGDQPGPRRDQWQATLGEAQYRWLHDTLLKSTARSKFVFAHHVNGTGRGGIEEARLYEWGGRDRNGTTPFAAKRPGWDLPIHDLMAKARVTVFFQGHDHLFARQELDGVIYQSTPNPADPTYQAFNRDAYRSGDILPNSGHLRVTVAPARVQVDYLRSYLPADRNADHVHGAVAFTYSVPLGER